MNERLSAIGVANTFLDFASTEGRAITHMQLQKHVFFAHGWYMGYTGKPLINEEVQAWTWGPVIPAVYHAFKDCKNSQIKRYAINFDPNNRRVSIPKVDDVEIREFLRKVWDVYKNFNAAKLSQISHEIGGPWDRTVKKNGGLGKNATIANAVIAECYRAKVKK